MEVRGCHDFSLDIHDLRTSATQSAKSLVRSRYVGFLCYMGFLDSGYMNSVNLSSIVFIPYVGSLMNWRIEK